MRNFLKILSKSSQFQSKNLARYSFSSQFEYQKITGIIANVLAPLNETGEEIRSEVFQPWADDLVS